MNNSNPSKSFASPTQFRGSASQSISFNNHVSQAQGGSAYPGHFHLSEPQAHILSSGQYMHSHPQTFQHSQTHIINSGNSGVFSPSMPTAGAANTKRSAQKPPPKPSGSMGHNASSMFKSMELTPAAPRKKRKPPEKQIPEKIAQIVPESALYTQMLEFESRIDAALARKKIDIQDSLKNPTRAQKTLRIYVFNTFSNQSGEKKDVEAPSWSLKIIGRILEDGKDLMLSDHVQKHNLSHPKFSSFFKKITVYLDQSLYPDNHVIQWENARSSAAHEGFEVRRKGDKEFTAMIRLELNCVPEKFRLSAALKEVLGLEVDTRPRIIAAIWHYIKAKKLQNPNDPSFFFCDTALQKIFGEDKMKFTMVSQKLMPHLTPPLPIHIEHKIRLSGDNPVGNTCYDVLVDMPFSVEKEMKTFLENIEKHRDIDTYNDVICASIKKIHEHSRRRAFFLAFSQSPAQFINSLMASQSKDLKIAVGDANLSAEKERLSEFYNEPWLEDAVIQYLNRKSAGSDA